MPREERRRSLYIINIESGEEDLLVLPLILELPNGSKIVYGQPNQGAVIRDVNDDTKTNTTSLLGRMEVLG